MASVSNTKYIYTQSTTLSVPSFWTPPHSLSRNRVSPPETKGRGTHSPAGEGVGFQFGGLENKARTFRLSSWPLIISMLLDPDPPSETETTRNAAEYVGSPSERSDDVIRAVSPAHFGSSSIGYECGQEKRLYKNLNLKIKGHSNIPSKPYSFEIETNIYGLEINLLQAVTFWYGSGSADPCLFLIDSDPDPGPAIFVIDLQDANKKICGLLITF
jgi:hypothetical protein